MRAKVITKKLFSPLWNEWSYLLFLFQSHPTNQSWSFGILSGSSVACCSHFVAAKSFPHISDLGEAVVEAKKGLVFVRLTSSFSLERKSFFRFELSSSEIDSGLDVGMALIFPSTGCCCSLNRRSFEKVSIFGWNLNGSQFEFQSDDSSNRWLDLRKQPVASRLNSEKKSFFFCFHFISCQMQTFGCNQILPFTF